MRWQSILTVTTAGGALMALEITAGRILAPSYGNSTYVWGGLIGIILLALGLGYHLGGHLADHKTSREQLALILAANAFLILATTLLYKPVLALLTRLPLTIAPLVASTLLFFPASLLAGLISPYTVKLETKRLARLGRTAGDLYAWATLGSVIGTFAATFCFTLFLSTTQTLLLLGAILFFPAIVLTRRRGWRVASTTLFLLTLALVIANAPNPPPAFTPVNGSIAPGPVDVHINSLYGPLRVRDVGDVRTLSISGGQMSAMNLSNPTAPVPGWGYVECLDVAFDVKPETKKIALLGIGAGVYPRKTLARYPGVTIDAVDINPAVVEVAEKYFGLVENEALDITVMDARRFVEEALARSETYDLIVLDVAKYDRILYYHVPFHLVTTEFFTLLRELAGTKGVLVMNVPVNQDTAFCQGIAATIDTVFNSWEAFDCDQATTVIVASQERVVQRAQKSQQATGRDCWSSIITDELEETFDEAIVFTDEYAPLKTFPRKVEPLR